jgi:YfiH family protein
METSVEGSSGCWKDEPADGHVTSWAGILLGVTVADCVPVFMVDPGNRTVGLLHAGWRGAAAGILEEGLSRMADEFGSEAENLHVHFGPSICGRCYEVGPEVFRSLGLPEPAQPTPIDLRAHLASRAEGLGVRREQLSVSTWCTRCGGSPFFSHRAGEAQRQVGFLGLKKVAPKASLSVGLCEDCAWIRVTGNRRGSAFYLCRRGLDDPAFPKYPRLPVLECGGFEAVGDL